NSSGDNEVREYYDTVRSQQALVITPALQELDKAIAREAGVEVDYDWVSLWQMDKKEQSEIRSKDAQTIKTLRHTSLFADDVLYEPAISLMAETMPGLSEASEGFVSGADLELENERAQQDRTYKTLQE